MKLKAKSDLIWIQIEVDKICIVVKKNCIYLACPDPGEYAERICNVYYATEKGHKRFMKERLMTAKAKVFASPEEFFENEAANFDFHLELGSKKNSGFSNRRIDDKLVDLWNAAVDGRGTDVQFIVENKVFTVHSPVLSARSPILATIYTSKRKYGSGSVKIIVQDTHPVHFEKFLKFLYTGVFEWPSFKAELLELAIKYHVPSLVKICSTVNNEVLEDELLSMIALVECS